MNIRIDEFYISSACRNTLVHIGGQAMKTNEMRGDLFGVGQTGEQIEGGELACAGVKPLVDLLG